MLQYANDPMIPGITGREQAALRFLEQLHIPIKDQEKWRHWIHLSKRERQIVLSAIAKLLLQKGFGHQITTRLIGEVYTLNQEKEGTELHDAKEFATLLNSTARYGQYDVGLSVCLGDRDEALKKARSLLRGHRKNLVEGIQYAKDEGIIQRKYVQYFHANMGIRDTIIGIVTNMLLNEEETRADIPLVGFADKSKDEVKASARATQILVDKGLDLSVVINNAAKSVDGTGGGHNIAAGATIPKGKEEMFLHHFEQEVKKQLS
jgi:RecJ-like exonuclease